MGRQPRIVGLACVLASIAASPVRAAGSKRVDVPTLDVPYLSQTEDLCGGAAAAMVLRYYGERHATAGEFADLVDGRAGGIAADRLLERVARLGWRANAITGSLPFIQAALASGRPVIVLVEDRPGRYHYLVVVGLGSGEAVVHDPEWGPSRGLPIGRFERAWAGAGFWAAVIQPPPGGSQTATSRPAPDRRPGTRLAYRAGVSFDEQHWSDAAALAAQAAAEDPGDGYAWDVLGSARFIEDDLAGALDAWNHVGKPRVDRVTIDGLSHTRFATVARSVDLSPNELLTPESLGLARRRLEELPDRSASRIEYRPQADGYATVDVALVERQSLPRTPLQWGASGAEAAVTREISASVPGGEGAGGLWSASWRWWAGRPRIGLSFAAPHAGRLAGIWRVDASWEAQTYMPPAGAAARETRVHGGLAISDWITPSVRYEVSAGLDAWNSVRAPFAGARLERRWLGDRLSLSAGATAWRPVDGSRAFQAIDLHGLFASPPAASATSCLLGAGLQAATDGSPLGLWSGAGTGPGRAPLLRAHRLVTDGAIAGAVFGRRLAYMSAEADRWMGASRPIRFAVAGFADAARAGRGFSGAGARLQVDVGGGLRIAVPATRGALRIDFAHGLRDGANALTVGWQR